MSKSITKVNLTVLKLRKLNDIEVLRSIALKGIYDQYIDVEEMV